MYHIVHAIDPRGVRTRFVVGCRDVADLLACDLTGHDFTAVVEHVSLPPARPDIEMERARQILQCLHPMGAPQ